MPARRIDAREFIKDMRGGMDDNNLMAKYGLSEDQLQTLFQKLVDADFITTLELWERARLSNTQITKAFVEAQEAIDKLS